MLDAASSLAGDLHYLQVSLHRSVDRVVWGPQSFSNVSAVKDATNGEQGGSQIMTITFVCFLLGLTIVGLAFGIVQRFLYRGRVESSFLISRGGGC